jgi:phage terminase large subunit-like protein
MHQKADNILNGVISDQSFYPVIYAANDEDDWESEEVWRRVNPSLGITVPIENMRYAYEDAKLNLANENYFRQMRLNQWVKQSTRWLNMGKWDACDFQFDMKELEGRDCYGGLDLSTTTDITAFVLIFPPLDEEDKYIILPFFWIPEEAMETRSRRDHVPYSQWVKDGYINATEGEVVHYAFIEKFIDELGKKYNIKNISFDRWNATQLCQNLDDLGFEMLRFGQGFSSMSSPTKELMRLVLEKRIAHGGNPVLRWMADNLAISTDPAGNIKPDKKKAAERIDGIVALIMALSQALLHDSNKSIYDKRGALIIDLNHPRGYYYSGEADT